MMHDTNRQARGEPCTHCTHFEKPAQPHATVTLAPANGAMGLAKLTAFQFAGETAAHGVPSGL